MYITLQRHLFLSKKNYNEVALYCCALVKKRDEKNTRERELQTVEGWLKIDVYCFLHTKQVTIAMVRADIFLF